MQQDGQRVSQQISQQLQQIGRDRENAAEKLFLLNAAISSQWEYRLSQHAQQHAQNEQVKQLAQRMVRDHQELNQQLQRTAQQLQLQLPQGLPEMKQQELQVLTQLPAEQFEKYYLVSMQANHARDAIAFQAVSQIAENEQVKQFASQQLTKFQEHMQEVSRTASAMGLPSSDEAMQAGQRITPRDGDTQRQQTTPRRDGDTPRQQTTPRQGTTPGGAGN
jgi:putative membrane protein